MKYNMFFKERNEKYRTCNEFIIAKKHKLGWEWLASFKRKEDAELFLKMRIR